MRITTKFTTSGERGLARFPIIDVPAETLVGDNGVIDEEKARCALSRIGQIQFSSCDNKITISFAVEFLDRIRLALGKLADDNPNDIRQSDEDDDPKFRTCYRKMNRESCCYVRVDISLVADGIRVAISSHNPKGVVGSTEEFAAIVAQVYADAIVALADDVKDNANVVLVEGEGCDGIFAWSREREKRREMMSKLEEKRATCGHHCRGFCTADRDGNPPDFGCPLYRGGNCIEPSEAFK